MARWRSIAVRETANGPPRSRLTATATSCSPRARSRPSPTRPNPRFLLGHQAVLLGLHAAVGAEGAARAIEILAVRGVAHQVDPEPRGSHGKRDAPGALVHPAPVVRVQLVDEEGGLVLDGQEDIPDAVALHHGVLTAAEEQ